MVIVTHSTICSHGRSRSSGAGPPAGFHTGCDRASIRPISVQETVIATLRHLDDFEPHGEGALQGYLRRALINAVRTVLRRANVRPPLVAAGSDVLDPAPNPLETIIDSEMLTRYEAALQRLSAIERDAVVARIEFSMSYSEVAALLDKPSADAARIIVSRALVKLTREMHLASEGQKPAPSHA